MARRGLSTKTLKSMLKKAGLKTTGRKAALTRRAKKAHLLKKGGVWPFGSSYKQMCEVPNPNPPGPALSRVCREQCLPGENPGSAC